MPRKVNNHQTRTVLRRLVSEEELGERGEHDEHLLVNALPSDDFGDESDDKAQLCKPTVHLFGVWSETLRPSVRALHLGVAVLLDGSVR